MSAFKLNRSVSLGVAVTIALQSAGALMWGAAAEARLQALETSARTSVPVAERLARLEEQMSMARQSLGRIETRLENRK